VNKLERFCKSSSGFTVEASFPRGLNTRAYSEEVECKNYGEVVKALAKFMCTPRVYAICVHNKETGEMQFIGESCWKN